MGLLAWPLPRPAACGPGGGRAACSSPGLARVWARMKAVRPSPVQARPRCAHGWGRHAGRVSGCPRSGPGWGRLPGLHLSNGPPGGRGPEGCHPPWSRSGLAWVWARIGAVPRVVVSKAGPGFGPGWGRSVCLCPEPATVLAWMAQCPVWRVGGRPRPAPGGGLQPGCVQGWPHSVGSDGGFPAWSCPGLAPFWAWKAPSSPFVSRAGPSAVQDGGDIPGPVHTGPGVGLEERRRAWSCPGQALQWGLKGTSTLVPSSSGPGEGLGGAVHPRHVPSWPCCGA